MKIAAAYIFFLAWASYFFTAPMFQMQHAVASASHHTTTTLNTTQTDKASDACCEKMHPASKTAKQDHCEKDVTPVDEGCCSDTNCAMVCCHISMVGVVTHFDNTLSNTHFPIDIHFHTLRAQHLPNPFIGIDFPPPNC